MTLNSDYTSNFQGENRAGKKISVNNHYMLINDRPVVPVMGEFHYSRCSREYWEDAILKMKAGGITLMATYVFWNLHEEEEGKFVWTGDKDLRHFLELCRKHDLDTVVRIGPFCHGEIRNGGIPDWLYGRPFQIRTGDDRFLFYVNRLYGQIGRQLKGLLFKDGGPVVCIQIENECQHSASPWAFQHYGQKAEWTIPDADYDTVMSGVGEQQKQHKHAAAGLEYMVRLKQMAIDAGMDLPLYTATGWGYAAVIEGETLPVQAAYPYPAWDNTFAPSKCYLFKDIRKHPDYSPVRYNGEHYPYFCFEMAGGMVHYYKRRPIVPAAALDALAIRTLGSGANGIGYYMYHGGLTPPGKTAFMNDVAIGVPFISYDFQAPIGEFGQLRPSYKSLRAINTFLNDFGDVLAPTETILPSSNEAITPADSDTLRVAARVKDNSGFLFLVNYQDYAERHDQPGLRVTVRLPGETISIPQAGTFTLKKDASAILPFNLKLNEEVTLKYATAQALARLEDGNASHYFFYAVDGINPTFVINNSGVSRIDPGTSSPQRNQAVTEINVQPGLNSTFEVLSAKGKRILVTTLTRDQALNTAKQTVGGRERVIVSDGVLLAKGDELILRSTGSNSAKFWLYADRGDDKLLYDGHALTGSKIGRFTAYEARTSPVETPARVETYSKQRYGVSVPKNSFKGVNELFLTFDYVGDNAMGFIDGQMVCDNFYYGKPWTIGLRRFMPALAEKGMYFHFKPMYEGATFLRDLCPASIPDLSAGDVVDVKEAVITPEYEFVIKISK